MKKVSVIIPVYNVEEYISDTIRSVLEQTYSNFELLIVNDGSPDRSVEICQGFNDPRIRIINQLNRGLAGARNTGIRHATGEYIAFLDGDDLWLPTKLAQHLEHLEKRPEVGISYSRSELIDQSGSRTGTYLMPELSGITVFTLLRGSPIGNGSAAVFRREVFEEIQFQDDRYRTEYCYFDEQFRQSEDIECWLRIAIQTKWQWEGIPEASTLYRVNPNGLSANLNKQFNSWEKVLEKTKSYAPDLITRWESLAKAYQLRYLARSAIRLRTGTAAAEFINRALVTYWRIILEEPKRTVRVLLTAYLLWLLPQSMYGLIERLSVAIASSSQKTQILRDQSQQST